MKRRTTKESQNEPLETIYRGLAQYDDVPNGAPNYEQRVARTKSINKHLL